MIRSYITSVNPKSSNAQLVNLVKEESTQAWYVQPHTSEENALYLLNEEAYLDGVDRFIDDEYTQLTLDSSGRVTRAMAMFHDRNLEDIQKTQQKTMSYFK